MRLLVASDLHGSMESLRFLLDKAHQCTPDALVLLGDLVYHGPRNPLPQGYDTRSMLQTEQTRNAALNQACSDFDLRLKDRDEQIRSLEEKHLHARDALEHYRSAVKEQREQDQRRHEGQLQQVQMELRQAQQSALVRQDEITQLHRDNERVLSESRALSKELKQAGDQQHKLGNLNAELTAQLGQLQSERTLLQERLRVAAQESEGLKQAHTQIQESHAALSLRAIKAETALESLQALNKDAEQSVLTKDQ